MTLCRWCESWERTAAVQIVARVSGKHVQMVVPDILTAGRLVMLACGDALTPIDMLEGKGYAEACASIPPWDDADRRAMPLRSCCGP
jgi:hypothetical protein